MKGGSIGRSIHSGMKEAARSAGMIARHTYTEPNQFKNMTAEEIAKIFPRDIKFGTLKSHNNYMRLNSNKREVLNELNFYKRHSATRGQNVSITLLKKIKNKNESRKRMEAENSKRLARTVQGSGLLKNTLGRAINQARNRQNTLNTSFRKTYGRPPTLVETRHVTSSVPLNVSGREFLAASMPYAPTRSLGVNM